MKTPPPPAPQKATFSNFFYAEVAKTSVHRYIIANPAEPDHSGSLPEIMRHCPNAPVITSRKAAESVPGHDQQAWNSRTVKTGDTLSLRKNQRIFAETPMLHRPDSRPDQRGTHRLMNGLLV